MTLSCRKEEAVSAARSCGGSLRLSLRGDECRRDVDGVEEKDKHIVELCRVVLTREQKHIDKDKQRLCGL